MTVSECLGATCECLAVALWSIVSLALGAALGTLVGLEMTVMVFLITLVRLPRHILKTLYLTATSDDLFTWCHYFDPFLRVVVFLLVPIPHVLWLIEVTIICLTIGTLFYIGKATKTVFKCNYSKAWSKTWTNIRLERNSRLGSYIDFCRGTENDQSVSKAIIVGLKGLCSLIPGVPLGALPFIPFTVAIVFITLYRLPINVYRTLRVAIRTVTLKWDLKIGALLMLPVIHTIFPVVVFGTALVGSFLFFIICTSVSIAEGKSPFQEWGRFQVGIKDYYEAHQRFVGEKYLGKLDHPTGIPSGWKGQQYGLPIHKILRWQCDLLVSCALLLYGIPICLAGSVLIFGVKLVPGIISWWRRLCKLLTSETYVEMLGYWALWLAGFLLAPVGAILLSIAAIFAGTLYAFAVPHDYLEYGCSGGLRAPFDVLRKVDSWDFFFLDGYRVLACLPDENPQRTRRQHCSSRNEDQYADKKSRQQYARGYWKRFAQQCILTTATLLEEEWITIDDVQACDISVLQAVPAIALLAILMDSIHDPNAKTSDHIKWSIDGTYCSKVERGELDNIAALLWPKVMEVKRLLKSRKKALAQEENVTLLAALLCANSDETTDALQAFLKDQEQDPHNRAGNAHLRSKLTELSLMILQVRPFQKRMHLIFNSDYMKDIEGGGVGTTSEDERVSILEPAKVEDEEEERQSPWQSFVSLCKQALDGESFVEPATGDVPGQLEQENQTKNDQETC